MGDKVEDGVYKVQSFTEKPERDFAKIFVDSGEFYWNTGIFLANAKCLLHCFEQLLPPVLRQYDEMHADEEFDYEERTATFTRTFRRIRTYPSTTEYSRSRNRSA